PPAVVLRQARRADRRPIEDALMNAAPIQPASETIAMPRTLTLPFDPLLLLATLGLVACSLVTIKGATLTDVPGQPNYFVDRQALYLGVGLVLMAVLARIDYSRLRELKYGIYGVLLLSILAVLGLGHAARG